MKKYVPINMPETALGALNFEEEKINYIQSKIKEAQENGTLKTNQEFDFEYGNLDHLAFWMAKTITPVEKPEINSDVEKTLEPFKKSYFEFCVDDVDIKRTLSFSAVGDLMATKGLELSKDKLYEGIADLVFDSDIIHGNLESTLTTGEIKGLAISDKEPPKINMNIEEYDSAVTHNRRKYDVFTIANNHILDCGEEGIITTLNQLGADQIAAVGVNRTADEKNQPQITEVAGIRIGWVAHTLGVNFKPFPEGKPWIVNVTPFHQVKDLDISHILDQIQACKAQNCDLVFATFHWGIEHELYPRSEQLKWARQMAEAGVDAIIGHHPHVPQLYEIIHPEYDKNKSVPVIYSLGNLTPVLAHPAMVLSLVLQMKIVQGIKKGKTVTKIANMNITPVAIAQEENGVLRLEKLTTLLNIEKDNEFSEYVKKIGYYADIVMGNDWRNV